MASNSYNPLVTLPDYEVYARDRMTHNAYEYVAGGAGDEITMRANREGFDRIRLRPRALVDVSSIDTSTQLFGRKMPAPILLAPCGYQKLVHPEGEVEAVRGAGLAGVTYVASTPSNYAIEEIASAASAPVWFQLYTMRDRPFTRSLVERAEAAGCDVLCVTVDAPIRGIRDRDARCCFALPPGLDRPNLRGLGEFLATANARPVHGSIYSPNLDPTFTWKDLEWLLGFTKIPVLLKGILSGTDAARGLEAGVHGIIVSNHGGRTVDTVPGSIEALPEVVAAVAGRVPVLLDSGVRRGADIVKVIAMGGTAVLIGRPFLYGLAINGAEGVRQVVHTLRTEFEMALALCGRRSVAEIDSSVLW